MASPSESSSPVASVQAANPNFSSSAPPSNSYASLTRQNIGSMVPIKLKRSNYLPWRALFAPILRRYKLLSIIDGTEVCPSPLLPDRSINPNFESWYEKDCWAALNWVFNGGEDRDSWVKDHVDFGRVFLVGDSAGANIAHHLALRIKDSDPDPKLKIAGIGMVNPYFWGKKPIGGEVGDLVRKSMVDTWWNFVCPSEKGGDDPLINPFLDGAPGLEGLACGKVLVMVAEKDILRDRGRLYYEELVKSKWGGRKELIETQGEDHDFHVFNPNCDKAKILIRDLGKFVNQD